MAKNNIETIAAFRSVNALITEEIEFTKSIINLRIKKGAVPERLEEYKRNPFRVDIDFVNPEAILEHIQDIGKLSGLKTISDELTKTIKNLEYQNEISE